MNTATEKFIKDAVDNYSDTVFRVAFQYTKNRRDAEDILQEVFFILVKKRPQLYGGQLKAWLIRVAINKSKDYLRASSRRAEVRFYEPQPQPRDDYSEVFDALGKLPERDRNALYLHYYEGYTAREIAGILGGTERAVTKRICRAREKLKNFLEA